MSVFVQRDQNGKVNGVHRNGQTEIADLTELAEGHPDVVAFYAALGAPTVTILYPVDLWIRLSDEETEQVEAAMAMQPVRIQNIFKSASSYRSDNEFWPLLVSVATQLFGAQRAAEILAPSEVWHDAGHS